MVARPQLAVCDTIDGRAQVKSGRAEVSERVIEFLHLHRGRLFPARAFTVLAALVAGDEPARQCFGAIACQEARPSTPEVDPQRVLIGAQKYLEAHAAEAFTADEPLYGLLPAIVGSALIAAGSEIKGRECEERLIKEKLFVESVEAKAAALFLLTLHMNFTKEAHRRRAEWCLELIEELKVDEFWGRSRKRGNRLGGAGSRSSDRTPTRTSSLRLSANPLALAGVALAFRTAERRGFVIELKDTSEPAGWVRQADYAEREIQSDGVHWPRGRSELVATEAVALVIALARTGMLPRERLEDSFFRRQERAAAVLDLGLDVVARLKENHEDPLSEWEELFDVVLCSRLKWSIGGREISWPLRSLLERQAVDGSFCCAAPLPYAEGKEERDIARFYETDPARRLLSTSLMVLALTQCGRAFDNRTDGSVFKRLSPWAGEVKDPSSRDLLVDLCVCDGDASTYAMLEAILAEVEPQADIGRQFLVPRAGWDFGLCHAATRSDRVDCVNAARRWLRQLASPVNLFRWHSQAGSLLSSLRGAEPDAIQESLFRLLLSEPLAIQDLVHVLEVGNPEEQRITLEFLAVNDAPECDVRPGRAASENEAGLVRLLEWLEAARVTRKLP